MMAGRPHWAPVVRSLCPRGPTLGLSCRCPLGMALLVYATPISPVSVPTLNGGVGGDRSRTSSVSVVCRRTACPTIFSQPLLVASSAVSAGKLVVVARGPSWPMVVMVESPTLVEPTLEAREDLALVMSCADGASQGVANVEVVGASLQQGDDVGGWLRVSMR
jgi:hypothetical protein